MTIHSSRAGGNFSSPGVTSKYAPDLGLEPVDLALSVRLDLPARTVHGEVTTTVLVRDPGATLRLDAIDLRDVRVSDPDGHALDWHYDGEHVEVQWLDEPEPGDRRRVTVTWNVTAPLSGMMFGDDGTWCATDHETERARYWLPCVDHPNVRTTLAIDIRASQSLTALANGSKAGTEDHEDGTRTTRWTLDFPCPAYLLCLAVGEFATFDGGDADGVSCQFFAPAPYTAADLERSFAPTAKMLRWMTAKLDSPFPFPKYFQFAVPGIGGAMENISLVSWDAAWVHDERLRAERGWLLDLVNLHEMAHSWFGDAIVCRDYAHVWLKESWATYMESVWVEDTEGADGLQWQIREEARAYRSEADRRYVRPIQTREFDSSWDMFDQHLYPGGAVRLHMLRKTLGDDVFWTGVRAYVATYTGQVVETADFRRTLEEVSGRSLARFFDQWFRSPGYPRLKATFSFDRRRGEAVIQVEQTQVDDKKGVGLFDLDLVVAAEVEGEWQRHDLRLRGPRAQVVLKTRKRPTAVVFDPDADALFSLEWKPGTDMLGHALGTAPTVAGRMQAAEALGRVGRAAAVDTLVEAFRSEPYHGVRTTIARALGAAGSLRAGEALAELLVEEDDPLVQQHVAQACGRYRLPSIAAALRTWLTKPRPYLATGAALESLAKQRDPADLDLLRHWAAEEGWWSWTRISAMNALAATRTSDALDTLLANLDPRVAPPQVRRAAVMGVGECARWLPQPDQRRALDALADVVSDPSHRVRRFAVRGLRSLGTAEAPGIMEGFAQGLADQDKPAVRREAAEVRRRLRDGGRVGALSKEVERLQERLLKAEKRVEDLEARSPRKRR